MTTLMTVLGIVVFAVGLLISIAWHELGHLSTAKLFGIRVPQYMVGFGPTIFSRKKGETEYGVKAVPFGGYIRMIGMFPPGDDGKIAARSTSPWRGMIEDARSAAFEELQPGDENRLFYTRKPWKRVIVMFAGPFMNLVLAVAIFLGVMMSFGVNTQTTSVGTVSQCVVPASASTDTCPKGAKDSPAKAAGLQPRDKIVAFNGHPTPDWGTLQQDIRKTTGPATITVERDGVRKTLHADLIENQVAKSDGNGGYVEGKYVTAGFLGFTPASGVVQQSFGQSVDRMGNMVQDGIDSMIALPSKIPDLWNAAFGDAPRKADSPMGVVGAARVGGEVASLDIPPSQRIATMLFLVAGFNLSLFLFNMLPLLPLDGGHIAGALWEAVRRHTARLVRRPDPGPFDVAKMMPIAYVIAGVFICFTLLVLVADVVNPVKIS
ncbi:MULTISPECIES: M50 family metallopeptidase [Streptomyces]|uniref:Membrane-associated protease RseP (Regulator of RpoE activity) n=2 Tax=Streptomyces TaxID=1883 RepID=A0ABT9KZL2_9ACTN|nr:MULTISPECIES: site-2 protease family protein [Streptomyces]MBW8091655.1 site-2 protease family protein [Streptomyces hygroscopicus subsp. hygroscopicus]MCO8301626.1 site-2 protease family protein [Streptomyces sp. RKCA744]MDN3058897.1 site-2 protease family protein [Streptomyces sp. SRF1]MDP9613901.1 membrane-associated protease RseP (regulator of RpoE activity) [Streptomyces demainii]GHJ31753.1 putative zinc metalloprotease [Streptomyces hygroscopicus]